MKVITLWNEKGGVGKTVLSLMLAGCAVDSGFKTLLLDCDPQRSSFELAEDNNFTFDLRPQSLDKIELIEVLASIETQEPQYDLVIVDMPPNTNRFPEGVCIIPYEPNRVSCQTTFRHLEALNDHCEKMIEVVSKFDTRSSEHRQFIVGNKNIKVNRRNVYERVTNLATTIFDPKCKNYYGCREAKKEIKALFSEAIV
jgi:chromosome partitioning protein